MQVNAYLKSRQLLLIFDGFEHVREGAPLLSQLVHEAPGVRMIITSRDRLPVPDVVTVEVRGLPYPEEQLDEEIERYGAVQLFLHAARRHSPDFTLTAENRLAVVRICRLVEGLPLGIELAAGWTRSMSCAAIAERIAEDLELLIGTENAQDQPLSMVAAIDYFWYMLVPVEQQMLQRLAVFRDGFASAAAQQVAGVSLFFLDGLVSKGYLHFSNRRRYETHELLRQYAIGKLRNDAAAYQAAYESHCRYYLNLLQQRELALAASRHMLGTVGAELENVRAAWAWALEQGWLDLLERSLEGLAAFYDLRAAFYEAATHFGYAAGRLQDRLSANGADVPVTRRMIGYLLAMRSRFLVRLALYEEAIATAREALDLAVALSDRRLEAMSRYYWAEALNWQGAADTAMNYYRQTLALAEQGDLLTLQSDALRKIGRILSQQGAYDEARAAMNQALELARRSGDRHRESRALNDLGVLIDSLGDRVMAYGHYEDCLRLAREIGDRSGEGTAMLNLGALALDQQRYAEAEQLLELALPIFRESSDRHNEAIALENVGDCARLQGDLHDAQHYYERAFAICRTVGEPYGEGVLLYNLGLLAYLRNNYADARARAGEALTIARQLGDDELLGKVLILEGHVLCATEQYAAAGDSYHQALAAYQAPGQAYRASEALAGLLQVALAQNDPATAEERAGQIADYLESDRLEHTAELPFILLACFRGLQARRPERARTLLLTAYRTLELHVAAIPREGRRTLFLTQIRPHREIVEEVQRSAMLNEADMQLLAYLKE